MSVTWQRVRTYVRCQNICTQIWMWCDTQTHRHFSLVGSSWSWLHKTSALRWSINFSTPGIQKLQRRARRHATINVVDFSDVGRCQNMVDVSDVTTCQNIRMRCQNTCTQIRMWCDTQTHTQTHRHFSLVGSSWSWLHKTSNYVDLLNLILSLPNWPYLILSFQIQKSWSCRSQIEIKSDPVVPNSKKLILSFLNWN